MIPSKDISFVVQGPVNREVTPLCLTALREHFPQSEIVLSTWEGTDTRDLAYDTLVLSADPGAVLSMAPDFPIVCHNNGNRQLVSTKAGLRAASRPFAAKLRSDLLLQGSGWLEHWDRYPHRSADWRMFQERVIIGNLYARNPRRDIPKPFHPSDWFMFGLRDDLLLLWDVDLEPEPESSHWFRTRPKPSSIPRLTDTRRYYAEQYLWKTLMLKFGNIRFEDLADASDENIRLTRLTFANNLIILEAEQFPLLIPKGLPRRTWRYACYTHREWNRLYQQYCGGQPLAATFGRLLDPTHWVTGIYFLIPHPIRYGAWKLSTMGQQLGGSVSVD